MSMPDPYKAQPPARSKPDRRALLSLDAQSSTGYASPRMTVAYALRFIQRVSASALKRLPRQRSLLSALTGVGLLLPILGQLWFYVDIQASRHAPIEVDDAYAYLIKATHLFEIDIATSPAYRDLQQQLSVPAIDSQDAWVKYNERHRLTAVFAPLHSFLLALPRTFTDVSWESIYSAFGLVGTAFQACAALFFLYALFGLEVAALSGTLLFFALLPHHGIHFVVPSTLSIACGLISIGLLFRAASPLALWLPCLAEVAFHPIGRIYVALVLLLTLLRMRETPPRPRGLYVPPLVAVVLATMVPLYFSESMSFSRDPLPAGLSFFGSLYMNISSAKNLVLEAFGGETPFVLLLSTVGFLTLPSTTKHRIGTMVVLVFLLLGAALFYVLPHFPAELFSRVWVLAALIALGLCSHALAVMGKGTFALAILACRGRRGAPVRSLHLPALFLALLSVATLPALSHFLAKLLQERESVVRFAKERVNIVLDPAPIQALLAQTSPSDSIIYLSEEPMHFALMHGLATRRAFYLPLVIQEPPSGHVALAGALAFNPIFRGPQFHVQSAATGLHQLDSGTMRASLSGILLKEKEWLEMFTASSPLTVAALRVESSRDGQSLLTRLVSPLPSDMSLRFVGEDAKGPVCDVTSSCSGAEESLCHIPVPCERALSRLRVQALRPMRVTGVQTATSQGTRWPWDRGLAVRVLDRGGAALTNSVEFSSRFLGIAGNWEVIADAGSLVALINRPPSVSSNSSLALARTP